MLKASAYRCPARVVAAHRRAGTARRAARAHLTAAASASAARSASTCCSCKSRLRIAADLQYHWTTTRAGRQQYRQS